VFFIGHGSTAFTWVGQPHILNYLAESQMTSQINISAAATVLSQLPDACGGGGGGGGGWY
jgi:hypothetical protein